MYAKENQPLTISTVLSLVCDNFRPIYGSQTKLFAALFASYHRECSDSYGYSYTTSQCTVSKILKNVWARLPGRMLVYYAGTRGTKRIRRDVDAFILDAVVTHQQRQVLEAQLYHLVLFADNVAPEDKSYVMDAIYLPVDQKLNELFARMLIVAICNSRCPRS